MQVVVVGSGYSGTLVANRVARKVDVRVRLVGSSVDGGLHLAGRSAVVLKEMGAHSAFSTARAGVSRF